MATQFTVYRSTDASAPVLTGQTGSLIALLDAVLINGYGAKAAAGWGHPFTGSSTKQVYRPATGNSRFYLRVLDDGSLTGTFRHARVLAGESMSDVDTFTNQFPSPTQVTGIVDFLWRKSNTADATARAWVIFADDRTLYLLIQSGDTGATTGYVLNAFGEYFSYVPNDNFNCFIMGLAITPTASTINFATGSNWEGDMIRSGMQEGQLGHYIARISAGTGSSTNFAKKGAGHLASTAGTTDRLAITGTLAYPNTSDGGLYLHPLWIMDGTTPDVVHGEMRGWYHPPHPITNFSDLDTLSGVGNFVGKSFVFAKTTPNSGVYVFETSATLRTN